MDDSGATDTVGRGATHSVDVVEQRAKLVSFGQSVMKQIDEARAAAQTFETALVNARRTHPDMIIPEYVDEASMLGHDGEIFNTRQSLEHMQMYTARWLQQFLDTGATKTYKSTD